METQKQLLKLTIIGQQQFGASVFTKLKKELSQYVQIVGVSAPRPKEGKKGDPLWETASEEGFQCVNTSDFKEEATGKSWKDLNADLSILAFVTDIIPNDILNCPKLGSIQYHPSLLPLHRGISSINWAVINQDAETGISIFWVDQYIDHGPILIQKKIPIGPHDTVKSLYFNQLFPMGVDAIVEGVKMIYEGNIVKINQDHKKATYEPPCKEPFNLIYWHQPAKTVYALIRGCDPQPGAYTMYNGKKLFIFDCLLKDEEAVGWVGKVIEVTADSFSVRLNGGTLHVKRVMEEGGAKISAGEWAKTNNLQVNYRFGNINI